MSNSHSDTLEKSESYQSYLASPYLSIKHASYFPVYDELLRQYKGQPITFVEIGVLNGGSLFMWRDFLGDEARIIGIDLNPAALRWAEQGFEIFIGNQAEPHFWEQFFEAVGRVDVILDDGGHTFEQQIVTAANCLKNIKDGGKLIIEDTHTSYLKEFGYPTKYSFIEWAKRGVDRIHSRFPGCPSDQTSFASHVKSLQFFESIVAFNIDRRSGLPNHATSNGGKTFNAEDYRYQGVAEGSLKKIRTTLARRFSGLRRVPFLLHLYRAIMDWAHDIIVKIRLLRLKKFFE